MPATRKRFHSSIAILAIAILAVPAVLEIFGRETFRVFDEWQDISHIIVATNFSRITRQHRLNGMAMFAAGVAQRHGINVVIATNGDDQSRREILQFLLRTKMPGENRPIILDPQSVAFVKCEMPGGWARDLSPMMLFRPDNSRVLCGFNVLSSLADSELAVRRFAASLGVDCLPHVGRIHFGENRLVPLQFQGGNWMTADSGRTLITTHAAIQEHDIGFDSNVDVEAAIRNTLKARMGFERIIALESLTKDGTYVLHNDHIDLQVRTLPHNKVIIARVDKDDEQHGILQRNACRLKDAGYDVIAIKNAKSLLPYEKEFSSKYFQSYTNSLFINDVVLIPSYGDENADRNAKELYERALNGEKSGTRFKVIQVPSILGAAAIRHSGSIRCAAMGLHGEIGPSDEQHQRRSRRSSR